MKATSRAKLLVSEVICHPLVGKFLSRAFRGRVPYGKLIIDTKNANVAPANVARIFWKIYEKSETEFVNKYLRRDLDVVELGSSLGVVSLHIIQVQERHRRLLCVEANPHLIETIHNNVMLNAPWKEPAILNYAVDYSGREQVKLSVDAGNLGSRVSDGKSSRSVCVQAVTLGQLLFNHNIDDYVLVADIEGAEAGIIFREYSALAKCRQMIIELHPAKFDSQLHSVDALRKEIEVRHGFALLAQRHDVCVFEKR